MSSSEQPQKINNSIGAAAMDLLYNIFNPLPIEVNKDIIMTEYHSDMPPNFPQKWYSTWTYVDERSYRISAKYVLKFAFEHGFIDEMDPNRFIADYREVFLDACPPAIYTDHADELVKYI